MVVHVRPLLEHFRHWRRLSGVSVSVGVHSVPSLWSVVAALRLVRTVVGGFRRPTSEFLKREHFGRASQRLCPTSGLIPARGFEQ